MPFVRAGRVAQARMEQHKGVKVGVIWIKGLSVVQVVEVLDVCGDLQLVADTIFDNGAKGILRSAGRKRVLVKIPLAYFPDR